MGQSNLFLLGEYLCVCVCVCAKDEAHLKKFKCVKPF